jgi:HEPN domain-containing protein
MSAYPVEEWIKKAEDNYISALALARRRSHPVPDVICNQCQQCAEKYLKALLVRHRVEFPKIHDLRELEDLVISIEPEVHLIDDYAHGLNPYGIDIRYPGRQATMEEAREAIKGMKEVRKFARAKLGLNAK